MKQIILSLIIIPFILGGCSGTTSSTDGTIPPTNNNGLNNNFNDNKNGNESSNETGNDTDNNNNSSNGTASQVVHNQGKNCLSCHSSGNNMFISGVTIYKSLNGADYDANVVYDTYNVRLVLDNGQVINYLRGNGSGNKFYNGNQGAINNFTSQIVDSSGRVVNSSNKNSHSVGRLACNSCHTSSGLNGAPGRVVGYNYYNKTLSSKISPK